MTTKASARAGLAAGPRAGTWDGGQPSFTSLSTTARQLVRNGRGQVIGSVTGDFFTKHVDGSRHMLRTPRAWACDLDALKRARDLGARWVVIIDDETGDRYRATLERMLSCGLRVNRGFGEQLALPLDAWTRTAAGDQEARQLGLGL